MPDSEQEGSSRQQTPEQKLLLRFKEGVRRLWASKTIKFLRDQLELRQVSNIPAFMSMEGSSLSRGISQGQCSLDALVIAANNADYQPAQWPGFDSKSLQRFTGWWFAYLQLKEWRSQDKNKNKFTEASKLFDSLGRTTLLCPLTVITNTAEDIDLTLPETIQLIWLMTRITDWQRASGNDSAAKAKRLEIATQVWNEYRQEIGLANNVDMPENFVDTLMKLQKKGASIFEQLVTTEIYVSLNN